VLREVEYEPVEGALSKAQFGRVYRQFLRHLVTDVDREIRTRRGRIGKETMGFWNRVVERCRQ